MRTEVFFAIGGFLLFTMAYLLGGEWNELDPASLADLANTNLKCSEELSELRGQLYSEQSNWDCLEYKNRTTINPEWVENCCVTESLTMTEASPREVVGEWGSSIVNISVLVNREDTARFDSGICFDPTWVDTGWEGATFTLNGKGIDADKCKATPQHIPTTEQFCVLKRLNGY